MLAAAALTGLNFKRKHLGSNPRRHSNEVPALPSGIGLGAKAQTRIGLLGRHAASGGSPLLHPTKPIIHGVMLQHLRKRLIAVPLVSCVISPSSRRRLSAYPSIRQAQRIAGSWQGYVLSAGTADTAQHHQ